MKAFKPLSKQFVLEQSAYDVGATASGSFDYAAVKGDRETVTSGILCLPQHLRPIMTLSSLETGFLSTGLNQFFEENVETEQAVEDDLRYIGADLLLPLYVEARRIYHDASLDDDSRERALTEIENAADKIPNIYILLGEHIKRHVDQYTNEVA